MKERLEKFVKNDKEYPLLAGFAIGFYVLAFYYSNNFELGSSWQHLLIFAAYYLLLPMTTAFIAYKIISKSRFKKHTRQVLFVMLLSFFTFFVLQNLSLQYSYKKVFAILFLLICAISFKINNYKIFVLMACFMSVFPLYGICEIMYANASNPSDWNKQPDGILNCKFVKKPNVYYLQADGYTNAETLKNRLYHYDNSKFDGWLQSNGFTLYNDFRSNYNSTLLSNSSCFNMKHHYARENVGFKNASDFVMDENPVLDIFKGNGYKTFFITERPYFLVSRPNVKFDYCNFNNSEVPYFKDGWSAFKEITAETKRQILESKSTSNFFFIQKFNPGHIAVSKAASKGIEGERLEYIQKLEIANVWLKDLIGFITAQDPNAIVIIGADHGGFVGFTYTGDALAKITDIDLLHSIFGAKAAIKWNSAAHTDYDSELKTSVNLFRTLFSFLSGDKSYLTNFQPDASYNNYDHDDMRKIYKAIE